MALEMAERAMTPVLLATLEVTFKEDRPQEVAVLTGLLEQKQCHDFASKEGTCKARELAEFFGVDRAVSSFRLRSSLRTSPVGGIVEAIVIRFYGTLQYWVVSRSSEEM